MSWKGLSGTAAFAPGGTTSQVLLGNGSPSSSLPAGIVSAADMPTGIDAAKIGAGAVSNTEFGYLDGVTSAIQTQLTGKQPVATGTPNGSKFLRDDNSWQAVSAAVTAVCCQAYKSSAGSNQSVSATTHTDITFDAEYVDTDAIHDNSTNTARFTVPTGKGGKWRFAAHLTLGVASAAQVYLNVAVNGTRVSGVADYLDSASGNGYSVSIERILSLSAGDYVTAQVYSGVGVTAYKDGSFLSSSSLCMALFERIGD